MIDARTMASRCPTCDAWSCSCAKEDERTMPNPETSAAETSDVSNDNPAPAVEVNLPFGRVPRCACDQGRPGVISQEYRVKVAASVNCEAARAC